MRKWINKLIPLIMIFILTSFSYNIIVPKIGTVALPKTLKIDEPTEVLYPKYKTAIENDDEMLSVSPPFLGDSYNAFKEALAFKESQGDYFVTNTLGYLGKYQFGSETLQLLGVTNVTAFLSNPILQEKVFYTNLCRNKWILRRDIKRFAGRKIAGLEITESGILAAAHLAGPGNVKKFLRSRGTHTVQDAYGSSIVYYMKIFAGYDVSVVKALRNPRI
ncbi:hypothetical protein [Cellulophaga omnivescoria]|uniref:hypothetical protein n=1 Tax=Cellulophaga omnivescoria TaxID=1888890 RepID=UPI0022F07C61|nr:hypothetical protein [Cellulophaga omnivescoria]WBU89422.1 hypothetical protein PBN93_00020 [Cellulophaga omnivescoria]WKB81446.1 hypothetical protein QYR09_00020 [Cellulophaga lytica]